MKTIYTFVFLVLITGSLYAQKNQGITNPFTLSVGPEIQVPVGFFANYHSVGFGATAQGEYRVSQNFGLTLNAGFLLFPVKSTSTGSTTYLPVLGGVKYWLSDKSYIHGQLGIALPTTPGGQGNFTYSPGIGFQLSRSIDALIKFVGISSNDASSNGLGNTVGLRLAYSFAH